MPNYIKIKQNSILSYNLNNKKKYNEKSKLNLNNVGFKSVIDTDIKKLNKMELIDDINDYSKEYVKLNSQRNIDYLLNHIKLKQVGTFSDNQKRNIKKNIEIFTNTIYRNFDKKKDYKNQPYITFLTLTLPYKQMHHDRVIKRCLTVFLYNLQKNHSVKLYLWKAETNKNGNIHFHILIDRYIDWYKLNRNWNLILSKFGYIKKYQEKRIKEGFVFNEKSKITRQKQFEAYLRQKKENFINPVSVDIQSLKDVKNVSNYVQKSYIIKENENRPVIGKIWGCSNNLKSFDFVTLDTSPQQINDYLQSLKYYNKNEIISKQLSEFVRIYIINVNKYKKNSFPLYTIYDMNYKFIYKSLVSDYVYNKNDVIDTWNAKFNINVFDIPYNQYN